MLAYEGHTRDRSPEIRAAGKVIPRGPGAGECLSEPRERPPTPELVKRLRGMTRPEPGQQRVFHSFAGDPPVAKEMRHGVGTKDSLVAGQLVNPPRKTKFQQVILDGQESIYNSKRKAPLGSSHDQSSGLPKGLDPNKTMFGTTTYKGESAGSIVSPPKSTAEIEHESNEGRELYKKSHNAWDVGEMVDRDYDWSVFTKESLYGVPTPHDNSGSQVRDALHWLTQEQNAKKAPIVSKRLDDFRERTQPQLGRVHDPIAETLDVPEGHTFGTVVRPDEVNAGELMHMVGPTTYQECEGFDAGVLASIRHHLKKNNFYNFDGLLDAMQHQDKDRSGVISADDAREVVFQFSVPITTEMLELVLGWCGCTVLREQEGTTAEARVEGVLYQELVMLLNWKVQLSDLEDFLGRTAKAKSGEETDLAADDLPQAEGKEGGRRTSGSGLSPSPALMSNYRTSSQMIKATIGGVPTHTYRAYGVPTIRSDLPAPCIKRVGDRTNYGDESDAYGLIYPSIYSNRGVYEEDFFAARQPEEVKQIFANIGVSMTPEVFQELWTEAARRDPKGQVSVESFRAIMEEVQAQRVTQQQT